MVGGEGTETHPASKTRGCVTFRMGYARGTGGDEPEENSIFHV